MFSYLRYFSIVSAVIVLIAAIALGYYFRQSAARDVQDLVIQNNRVLVQGYINNIWKDHEMVQMLGLFKEYTVPPGDWYRYRGFKENFESFSRESFYYFEEMPVVQVTIYNSQGEKIVSLNPAKILPRNDQSLRLTERRAVQSAIQRALRGNKVSQLMEAERFVKADGSSHSGMLVQSVMPILSDSYVPLLNDQAYSKESNVEGVVEIYYDITSQWERLNRFQYFGTGAILFIFTLLIGTLIIVASKAEGIITRQHEANVELAAQASAAETENQNKSQFLASISHELRTPLNAIIGFSEIIKNEVMGALNVPQYKDYIRDIHNSGVHLLSLINDILDYSKAEAGKLEMQIDEVDVTKLIHASIRLVAPRAEHAQVKLLHELPKEHFVIRTDGKKVKQVMLNLLSNAVKFTPPEGEVNVTMWHNVSEDQLFVEVKDSGIGIAPKDIPKALAPFGQVDSTLSRKYEGTGLGLPLTKKFVEIMGGTFRLESEEGKGTSITFTLPMKKVDIDKELKDEPKAESKPEARPAPMQSQPMPEAPQSVNNTSPVAPQAPPVAPQAAAPAAPVNPAPAMQPMTQAPIQPAPLQPQPQPMLQPQNQPTVNPAASPPPVPQASTVSSMQPATPTAPIMPEPSVQPSSQPVPVAPTTTPSEAGSLTLTPPSLPQQPEANAPEAPSATPEKKNHIEI